MADLQTSRRVRPVSCHGCGASMGMARHDPSEPEWICADCRESGRSGVDHLCALWVDRAPRFGAVAAHFPVSTWAAGEGGDCERVRTPWSGFRASFWAPEVFFSWGGAVPGLRGRCLPWYGLGGKRAGLDKYCAGQIAKAPGGSRFWAPEVLLFGDLYARGFTRAGVDIVVSQAISEALAVGPQVRISLLPPPASTGQVFMWADLGKQPFWSPELPEVDRSGRIWMLARGTSARACSSGWREVVTVALLLLVLALPAGAQTLFGVVSKVSDGDTLVVGEARIRLFGIDAPEARQECRSEMGSTYWCGEVARARLLGEGDERPLARMSSFALETSRALNAEYQRLDEERPS